MAGWQNRGVDDWRTLLLQRTKNITEDEPNLPAARRHASVLVVLSIKPEPALLFTKRPDTMKSHPGQIAFPGGRREPRETALQAALQEEVALSPSDIEVVGRLRSVATGGSDFWITPFVALSEETPAVEAHLTEVDELFWIPLAQFLDFSRHTACQVHGTPLEVGEKLPDFRAIIDYWDCDTEAGRRTVWGATGIMMRHFLQDVLEILVPDPLQ